MTQQTLLPNFSLLSTTPSMMYDQQALYNSVKRYPLFYIKSTAILINYWVKAIGNPEL